MFEILKQTVKICEGQGVECFLSSTAELQLSLLPTIGAPGWFCRLQCEEAAIRHSGAQLFSEEVAQGSSGGAERCSAPTVTWLQSD